MRHLLTISTCLVTLALHSAAWAEIYETRNAEGNAVFTDSPPDADAEVIDLQQTNVIDAPQAEPEADPQGEPQPGAVAADPEPVEENNTVIVNDGNNNLPYEENLARERALERADPAIPHEVGDSNAQMPHEVGDSDAQMPHEVGDSDAQMPNEVGDFPAPAREEFRR